MVDSDVTYNAVIFLEKNTTAILNEEVYLQFQFHTNVTNCSNATSIVPSPDDYSFKAGTAINV